MFLSGISNVYVYIPLTAIMAATRSLHWQLIILPAAVVNVVVVYVCVDFYIAPMLTHLCSPLMTDYKSLYQVDQLRVFWMCTRTCDTYYSLCATNVYSMLSDSLVIYF